MKLSVPIGLFERFYLITFTNGFRKHGLSRQWPTKVLLSISDPRWWHINSNENGLTTSGGFTRRLSRLKPKADFGERQIMSRIYFFC